jgi:hypothetical protein
MICELPANGTPKSRASDYRRMPEPLERIENTLELLIGHPGAPVQDTDNNAGAYLSGELPAGLLPLLSRRLWSRGYGGTLQVG